MAGGEGRGAPGERTLGFAGATGIGVGAIVGGGIFVLVGPAFAEAGPGATLAFALNGLLAFAAAFSFAELATSFPENGGSYAFARKVLSVRAAFGVGWVLWFAHIVIAVLYALGFATFAVIALDEVSSAFGVATPSWVARLPSFLAVAATLGYSFLLARRTAGGRQWANLGKVIVFALIIAVGTYALIRQPAGDTAAALTPFFPGGVAGLVAAMGFTSITLQSVGLIAAVGGEIKDPSRNIPRAMFATLILGVVLYVPLVFLLSVVGVEPGGSIQELASADRDGAFIAGVRNFMGTGGYWLVLGAGILATLSALNANLLAASRVALSMARDRTLPSVVGRVHAARRTPVMAIYATALAVVAILFMTSDLAAAGAAASLIFLFTYVLTHVTAYLARVRGAEVAGAFRMPMFPVIPLVGALGSGAVAVFQAVRVPDAGGIALVWLGLGLLLYLAIFKSGAETADESAEGLDPGLARLRGKDPLVLVPIANPAHARSMVEIANALAPSDFARVLLLTIVPPPKQPGADPLARLEDAQKVVKSALEASYASGQSPVAMISAASPWEEIRRIAVQHDCQSLLLGLGTLAGPEKVESEIERLLNDVTCDVSVVRADPDWKLAEARRILVPVGGRGEQHGLRAFVLGSLCRDADREVTFVTVRPADAGPDEIGEARAALRELAERTAPGAAQVEVLCGDDPASTLVAAAADHDLLLLGLRVGGWGKVVIGEVARRIAREAPCAVMLLCRHRQALPQAVYRPIRDAALAAVPLPLPPRRSR